MIHFVERFVYIYIYIYIHVIPIFFVPEGKVMAAGGRFVNILVFFVDNTSGFSKLSTKITESLSSFSHKKHNQTFKKPPNIRNN